MERVFSFGFLAPPTVFITLCLVGALVALRWRRTGIAIAAIASLGLFAAATPAVSSVLLLLAEGEVTREADVRGAQAIVVLGGDVRRGNGADLPDRLGGRAYERLAFAAEAYRRLRLPVAVSGGRVAAARTSEAALMQAALETLFAVPVAWSEDRSRTTWENAVYTARLLRQAGVSDVVVVTHAAHLPRALWAFAAAGLKAQPWPAPRTAPRLDRASDYLPSVGALQDSFDGLHEIIGARYYRLRY